MYPSIAILGRQPQLGIAELECLFGADTIQPFGESACFVDIDSIDVPFSRLGGTIRFCQVLTKLPNDWQSIEKYLIEHTPEHAEHISGKLVFGISVFGVRVPAKKVARTALQVKKAIRSSGKSVRMVPHNDVTLGSATVLYNKLTGENGWELCIVSDGKETYLTQTTHIQDIDAYAARDQKRPYRDAKVGMLPPKLAQIIINLAKHDEKINPQSEQHLLDPFCGTGVLLQEALLMGYFVHGSDIDPRMIMYTKKNIDWLAEKYDYPGTLLELRIADATNWQWLPAELLDSVACETYLGKPLSTLPPSDQLRKIMHEANEVNHKFLMNISKQIRSGTRLCLGVPSWRSKHEFLHLPMLDHLTEMGYNRLKFKHVDNADLIYHRQHQVVGRELLVLEKQ